MFVTPVLDVTGAVEETMLRGKKRKRKREKKKNEAEFLYIELAAVVA